MLSAPLLYPDTAKLLRNNLLIRDLAGQPINFTTSSVLEFLRVWRERRTPMVTVKFTDGSRPRWSLTPYLNPRSRRVTRVQHKGHLAQAMGDPEMWAEAMYDLSVIYREIDVEGGAPACR